MTIIKKISLYLAVFLVLIIPVFVYGQDSGTPLVSGRIPNPLASQNSSLLSLIDDILTKIIMPIAAVFVTIWIIYAGFMYVVAQGKPAEVSKAHSRLLWSLIGAGILLGAVGISHVVVNTVNELISTN